MTQPIILSKYKELGIVSNVDSYEVEFYRESDDSYHYVEIINEELQNEITQVLKERNYSKEHMDYFKSVYCVGISFINDNEGDEEFYQWKEEVLVDSVENESIRYTLLTKKEISYLKKVLKKL